MPRAHKRRSLGIHRSNRHLMLSQFPSSAPSRSQKEFEGCRTMSFDENLLVCTRFPPRRSRLGLLTTPS